ncbi:MAG: hypothetical protein H6737_13710, partial [Alphaproteobacteria bacterium]|nr:hypothetical protein [Alphaproteobacteria bacterium]
VVSIDPCTGAATLLVGLIFPQPFGGAFEGFSYDASTDTFWAAWGTTAATSDQLSTVDLSTGTVTVVATITGTVQNELDAMEAVNGSLYGRDGNGVASSVLYSVDPVTGVATSISTLPELHPRGFTTDADGLTWWAGHTGQLYTMSYSDGVSTAVGTPSTVVGDLEWLDLACP